MLSTNPRHRIFPSSKHFTAKPSHFLTHPRRSHRFHVLCNQKPLSEGRVDRRNMLLGLGGLYGTANLISDKQAFADPIRYPDFTTCGKVHDVRSGDPLDVNCCPEPSDKIKDYVLPRVTRLRRRLAAHSVTRDYIAQYEEGIRVMKDLDTTDPKNPHGFTQQANIHCAYCNGAYDQVGAHVPLDIQVHECWLFYPFHRWYLHFYERILGRLINNTNFGLPFWNWDNPEGMQMPMMFANINSPLYNLKRNHDSLPPAIIDFSSGAPGDIIANNRAAVYNEMIGSISTTEEFMGQPYKTGSDPQPGAGSIEKGTHNMGHWWVGDPTQRYREDMGNFYSAGKDPLFYCHHANVDRLWIIWQTLDNDVKKYINDPDYYNTSFLFYDEHFQLVRVKVADCLDHRKMGYEHEEVATPWMDYTPPKKGARSILKMFSSSTAQNAEGLFPLTLNNVTRVLIPKAAKGKADEVLVIEGIETDTTKFVKFDVFMNDDEDDKLHKLDKAEYAGTFSQVPHRNKKKNSKSKMSLRLTQLYENIDIGDEDTTVVITLVPRSNGDAVTIGGIKIKPSTPKSGLPINLGIPTMIFFIKYFNSNPVLQHFF